VRALARGLAAIAALLALAVLAAAILLPRWLAGDAARERLLAAAREATGREVAVGELSLALFPPRLVAGHLVVGDAAAPLVTAERADLRVRVAPLLAGLVVIESASLDGVAWRIPRTAAGLELPVAARAGSDTMQSRSPKTGAKPERAAPIFAVERVTLRHSQVVWDDVAASPPVRIELQDVTGAARGTSPDEPIELALSGTLASGGRIAIERSTATLDAQVDLTATLEDVALAPFAPYLGRDLALAGRAAGTVRASGPLQALERLEAELAVADAELRAGDVAARGPVAVKARLAGALDRLAGELELDATQATLRAYGGAFEKPAGAPATATGRLVRDAAGKLGVDGVRVQIKNMEGRARSEPGAWRLEVPPFDLARFLGLAHGPLELRGALRATAAAVESDGVVATAGGQPVAIRWRAAGLDGDPRHELAVAIRQADARLLLAALTGDEDLLEGPLTLEAALAGPLGGGALAGLAGTVDLDVGAGRIPSVSPLRAALDGLARFDEIRRALDPERAQRSLGPYLGDRFESLAGRFDVAGGRARTREALGWNGLVLRYPGYRLELRGAIGLADQALDAKGRVVMEPELEAALAGRDAPDGAGARVIEVASVRGTLAEPKLVIDQAGAAAFAASLALAQQRDRWERKIDDALGAGSGSAILDALDGFLGRKERR
jgi:hypothetical protein